MMTSKKIVTFDRMSNLQCCSGSNSQPIVHESDALLQSHLLHNKAMIFVCLFVIMRVSALALISFSKHQKLITPQIKDKNFLKIETLLISDYITF